MASFFPERPLTEVQDKPAGPLLDWRAELRVAIRTAFYAAVAAVALRYGVTLPHVTVQAAPPPAANCECRACPAK